jgi:hypothetical protein
MSTILAAQHVDLRLFLIFTGHPGPAIQARVCPGTSGRDVKSCVTLMELI